MRVTGRVRFPGEYPLEDKMSVKRLLIAAGGLTENAFSLGAEITRYEIIAKKSREIQHVSISLGNGQEMAESYLSPHDVLHIQRLPNFSNREYVTIEGEVQFPGEYTISRDETLSQIIKRAGGITEGAYVEAAIFTREDLIKTEAERLKEVKARVQSELEAEQIQATVNEKSESERAAMEEKSGLLEKLDSAVPLGRLVIDLNRALKDPKTYDVKLRSGDRLFIPRFRQEVSVMGEVQVPISHLYDASLSTEDYIERSGGVTVKADEGHVYIIKANGGMTHPAGTRWFRTEQPIAPGDTIVVPLDVDHIKPLELWTKVTQILYQSAVTVAALTNLVK